MTARPSEEARRALRAARERRALSGTEGAQPGASSPGAGPAGPAGGTDAGTDAEAPSGLRAAPTGDGAEPAGRAPGSRKPVPGAASVAGGEPDAVPAPSDGSPAPAGSAGRGELRPGDVAREALRRALAARRHGGGEDRPGGPGRGHGEGGGRPAGPGRADDGTDPPEAGAEGAAAGPADTARRPARQPGDGDGGGGGEGGEGTGRTCPAGPAVSARPGAAPGLRAARPADAAREALRAARQETRPGAAPTKTRPATPAGDTGTRPRAGTRTHATPPARTDARTGAIPPVRPAVRPAPVPPGDDREGGTEGPGALPGPVAGREDGAGGDARTESDTASGPAASGPAASGPAASGPAASGPAASGPAASGPAASGPAAAMPAAAMPAAPDPAAAAPAPAALRPAAPARQEPSAPTEESRTPTAEPPTAEPPAGRKALTPRSMAAPARDGELRRTFPALPARAADDAAFAETWWGNAWVAALEEGALDGARLARGRAYAARGHVDAITVTPGLALAYVQGSRPRPYRVQVRLRTLGDDEWERFLQAAAERPGHIAALLDKELPQSLADCGAPLLPGPGDLEPRCGCPDAGHPCKHAAALCYQTARLLDADPFVLLLLRGRGERGLLESLSRLSAARAARAVQERAPAALPAVRATDVLTRGTPPAPPPPLPAPPHPEQPPVCPAAPGGPDPLALDQLATDAAARAHALLTTGRDPVGGLTPWQDAVRLAAARPGSGLTASTRALYSSLAAATRSTPAGLARAVAAWRQGGLAGLTVLEETWDPPAGRFDRALPLLRAADLPAFRPRHNTLTHPAGHLQLRLGRDGLWYAYESEPGRDDWWPRGTPDPDPVGALTGPGAPGTPGKGTHPWDPVEHRHVTAAGQDASNTPNTL